MLIAGTTGVAGTGTNQFNLPWNIFLDSSNTLYVADNSNSRIRRYYFGASTGTTIAGTGVNGSTATQLYNPRTVVADGNNIYVADSYNYRVQRFANGSLTGATVASSRLGIVMSVELDNQGNIYTTDMSNNTVWKNETVFASGQTPYQICMGHREYPTESCRWWFERSSRNFGDAEWYRLHH